MPNQEAAALLLAIKGDIASIYEKFEQLERLLDAGPAAAPSVALTSDAQLLAAVDACNPGQFVRDVVASCRKFGRISDKQRAVFQRELGAKKHKAAAPGKLASMRDELLENRRIATNQAVARSASRFLRSTGPYPDDDDPPFPDDPHSEDIPF